MTRRAVILGGLAGLVLSLPATAQEPYPTRAVRVVVPFAAGGGADLVTRAVSQQLAARLGQPFVIDNRPGGAGTIGTEIVARAPADGYTLIVVGPNHTTNPHLFSKLPFDPLRDFAPIALLTAAPYILLAHPALPMVGLPDLIASARSRPGQLNYGSTGNGSAGHLAMEMIKTAAAIDIVHIPYKGSPPMLADLMGGQVAFAFDNVLSSAPLVAAGRLRALATSSIRRSPFFPDTPTVAEAAIAPGGVAALADFDVTVWQAMLAPAGTSPAIVARLNHEVDAVLASATLTDRMTELGVAVIGGAPADLARFLAADLAKWAVAVRASGARLD
ncbi:MAG: tripartite tricarboxylate transporter substrate binding protein [Pseudomonadota bacterium]